MLQKSQNYDSSFERKLEEKGRVEICIFESLKAKGILDGEF